MSETRESNSRPALVAVALLLLLFFVPILYVLSVGPASWLANHQYVDLETTRVFYWPIIKAHDTFPPLQPVLQGYVSLFE